MANFKPLKNYILYCLNELVKQHSLGGPFLDVGCGIGDISLFLAHKGWEGKAIDFSETAVQNARKNLSQFPKISVKHASLDQVEGTYNTILLMDVIEHIEDDSHVFEKVFQLLRPQGYLVISTPSNPREWRWDDDFYGHLRRYTLNEMKSKLEKANLYPLIFWDFTYPFFWIMRRAYTKFKTPPRDRSKDILQRTKLSSFENAWEIPFGSNALSKPWSFWNLVYKVQFNKFRNHVDKGHEMIILAQKRGT